MIFQPEDFDELGAAHELSGSLAPNRKVLADFCNAKFNQWLYFQMTVYGNPDVPNSWGLSRTGWVDKPMTHKARLVFIEKLEGGE